MKRLDRVKAAFLAQVSHKLKTPLTSLSLGLEELERYAENLHPGDPCHQRLSSMREDIASFSKVLLSLLRMQEVMVGQGGGRVSCDLAEMVREALELAESRTDQHRVRLDLAELPLVMVEHERMSFALQQILDNAFKFTRSGDTVSVVLAQGEGGITITIADNGCGITLEALPRLFDMSYQVDPDTTGQVPGFGLGLFCAREIIRQHGGSIAVDSREGKGTSVTLSLPVSTVPLHRRVKAQMMVAGCFLCELFSDSLVTMPV